MLDIFWYVLRFILNFTYEQHNITHLDKGQTGEGKEEKVRSGCSSIREERCRQGSISNLELPSGGDGGSGHSEGLKVILFSILFI